MRTCERQFIQVFVVLVIQDTNHAAILIVLEVERLDFCRHILSEIAAIPSVSGVFDLPEQVELDVTIFAVGLVTICLQLQGLETGWIYAILDFAFGGDALLE